MDEYSDDWKNENKVDDNFENKWNNDNIFQWMKKKIDEYLNDMINSVKMNIFVDQMIEWIDKKQNKWIMNKIMIFYNPKSVNTKTYLWNSNNLTMKVIKNIMVYNYTYSQKFSFTKKYWIHSFFLLCLQQIIIRQIFCSKVSYELFSDLNKKNTFITLRNVLNMNWTIFDEWDSYNEWMNKWP